eukprot:2681397-Amphidinium_carterae.3
MAVCDKVAEKGLYGAHHEATGVMLSTSKRSKESPTDKMSETADSHGEKREKIHCTGTGGAFLLLSEI